MNKKQSFDVEKVENKKVRLVGKDIYLFIFLLVLLLAGLSSLSFAFYRQYQPGGSINSNNTITTGNVIFAYSDATSSMTAPANGVEITNAVPLTDTLGMIQLNEKSYFDFQILSKPDKGKIHYQVVLEKMDGSTLSDQDVKIYITNLQGTEEVLVEETINYGSVKTYSQYENINHPELTGKILFERDILVEKYQEKFRLRMWIREQAKQYHNKSFSVRVNVNAYSIVK